MIKPVLYDPRNEESFDTYEYGTEPIPGDRTWTIKKAPDGAIKEQAMIKEGLRLQGK